MNTEKGKRKYRKYDAVFKTEAVNQIKNGRSVKTLSTSLGVSEALLYRWKSESEGKKAPHSAELKQLKKELARVKEDNEILKKALTIFSQSG